MRLAALRVRMVWAALAVFIVGTCFAAAVVYVIDLVFGYLATGNWFVHIVAFPIPFTTWWIPLPANIMWAFLAGGCMLLFQWLIGAPAVRAALKLRYVDRQTGGRLYKAVEQLSQEAGIPMPKVAIVESSVPNAFVFGRRSASATLVVHSGLINTLNHRELRAVLGHEMGHIGNRDLIVMTLASAIPLIAFMVFRGAFWGTEASLYSGGGEGDECCGIIILALLVIAAIAALSFGLSLLAVRGLSRMREYYADAYAARLTGDPRGLQSGLSKITWGISLAKAKGSGLRSLYIGDPQQANKEVGYVRTHAAEFDLDKDGVLDERELIRAMESEAKRHRLAKLRAALSTHPPTYKRIQLLKQLEKELAEERRAVVAAEERAPRLDAI